MQIIPSILEKNIDEFIAQINRLRLYFNHFQIDIADGQFVPNKTIQLEEIINNSKFDFKGLAFDIHLMVNNYRAEIKKLFDSKKTINVKTILVHYSVCSPAEYSLIIHQYPRFSIGLTLNPQEQVGDLASQYDLKEIQAIQIMTVNPGFQGAPFIEDALNKIEQLRKLGYRNKIYIDGAVNNKTIPIILSKRKLPDVLCPGSFLTKANDLEENIRFLKKYISM
jgi:ribulose-phosphate 3-epimerase